MKTLIVGDTHITEESIPELMLIFDEICNIKADRIIQLGDWFDSNRPTPLELKFSTTAILTLKEYFKEIIVLSGTGNHDLLRGTSVVEHLEGLGVKVVKGDYIENDILYGHFMLHESKLAFGTGKCGLKDLAKYKYVFLGHQHSPQNILPNVYHVGSVRYCSFNEVTDEYKKVVLIDTDSTTTQKRVFEEIKLEHTVPMIDVYDINQLSSIDARTKVRYICNSFEDFRLNASLLNKSGKKFAQFKIKLNFKESKNLNMSSKIIDARMSSKTDIIKNYITNISDKEVAKLLKQVIDEQ